MQTLCIALSFVVASSAIGQSRQAEPVAAPAPTVRFPAAWYLSNRRPGDVAPSTQAPITGAPYSATQVTTYPIPAASGLPAEAASQSDGQYRDSAGRTRTEQSLGPTKLGDHHTGPTRKEIEVNDVVTHCMFHWGEPWTGQGQPIATVSCFPTMYFSPWDTSWGVKAQVPSESTAFNRTTRNQPLGHKTIEGLDCLGIRSTLTTSLPAKPGEPSLTEQVVLERWWSPEIDEVIRFGPVTPRPGVPTFELNNLHPGEPDAALFYPPANYRIVRDGDPVP